MYQGYDVMDPTTAHTPASFALQQAPATPVAGGAPIRISAQSLSGMWSLRFGRFGCLDSETRGGVVVVAPGDLLGGDSNFSLPG